MLLFIHILLTFAVAAFAQDCPPSDKLDPCSCGEDEGFTMVKCEDFNTLSEIKPAVKNSIGYNVSFGFYRSKLIDIPSDFFEGHTSVRLRFEHCLIRSFGEKPFTGLEKSLKALYIYQSIDKSATNLDALKFSHLENLQYFSAAYNNFDELGNHWFEGGPASLTQLDLDMNEIERVGEKALSSLVNLQQLYVGGNQIKAVARSMLPNPMKNLFLLVAKSNQIEELPSDAFEGYPNLRIMNLADNKLKSIPENVWGKIWPQLEQVYIDGNDILCDENLKWIYTQTLPKRLEGKCGPGNGLQGRDLNSLKLGDFQ